MFRRIVPVLMALTLFCSFFGEVLRIGSPGYLPNEADVLRARQKSVGIEEARFNMWEMSCVLIFGTLDTFSLQVFMTFTTALLVSDCILLMLDINGQKERNGFTVSSR